MLEACQTLREISVKASDNVGVSEVNLRIFDPKSLQVYSTFMYRISGNVQSGIWNNDWAIPCNSSTGVYRVEVQAKDAAGNLTPWTQLPSFQVQLSSIQDKFAPVFVSGKISTGPITIGKTVPEISARFTDDVGIATVTISIFNPKGVIVESFQAGRTTGTKIDGTYKNDWATKPSYSPGQYSIYVDAEDEWKKRSKSSLLGYIDLVSQVTPSPVPDSGVKQLQVITFPSLPNMELGNPGTKLAAVSSSKLPVSYSTTTPTTCQILEPNPGTFFVQYQTQKVQPNSSLCTVVATQNGNDVFSAATSVMQSFNYSKAVSKIGIKQSALATASGVYVYATVSKTQGLGGSSIPISITSATPDICSVDDVYFTYTSDGTRSTVRALKNGSCSIKFVFPGDQVLMPTSATWFTPISGITEIPVGSNTAQIISFPQIADREYGPGAYLNATTTSGLPISYKSLAPEICQILYPTAGPAVQAVYPRSGLDSAKCVVEASQVGDSRYAPAVSVQRSFNWVKSAMKITISRSTALLGKGPHTIDAAVLYIDNSKMGGLRSLGHKLDVTTSTPNVCSVVGTSASDQRGGVFSRSTVAGLVNGTCSLQFKFIGTDGLKPVSLNWTALVSSIK